uniref:CASP-like protein 4D1 n=1 Tax=Erigeron canadensis TaxID=72917 RepID=UPI001CB93EE7|nr:CASP-like protein 4D1 [Erigeron canadensis]
MLCNSYKLDGDKTTWKDIKTYRYVFATAVIGVVYMLIQIPFALYYVVKEKRLIQHSCLPEFDFYADKLISYILATGVGAGFAASLELKQVTDSMVAILAFIIAALKGELDLGFDINQFNSKVHKFLDRGIIATVLLTLGFACMVVISVISSLNRSGRKNYFG